MRRGPWTAHAAPGHPVAGTVYPLIVQYCHGEIWQRPGLDTRLRALCAVTGFAFTLKGLSAVSEAYTG